MARQQIRGYAASVEHLRPLAEAGPAPTNVGNLGRRLADQLSDLARAEGRTRAWPLVGGPAAWERQAAQLAAGWRYPAERANPGWHRGAPRCQPER